MKKIYLMIALVASLGIFSACSDDDYTSKYDNPAQTTKASCDKLMTGVFYAGKDYTYNTYWRMYTWDNGIIGKYAQTIGFTNSPGSMYSAQDSYANNRWENFYKVLANFRALQNVYENESENDQKNDKIFLLLSEIFLYDHLSQIIDFWGDVPFEQAGYLAITGDVAGSYASYDDAVTLYTHILSRLGELATEVSALSNNLSPIAAAALPAQDFLCKGDLNKWVKYCNDLRLRLAVRVASQGDLASTGRAAVAEILNGHKSISSSFSDNISLVGDNGSTDEFNFSDAIRDGYKDHSRANQAMLDVLLTADKVGYNDYRLPIMYSTNAAGDYKGLSTHEEYGDQETNIALVEAKRVYSRIDSTTVIYNQYLRHPIISTAEVDFLRAEAYQQGWANGDAKEAFIDGVVNSTKYYFDCNAASESTYGFTGTEPAESDVRAFAEALWNKATNKLEVIIEQKWLNFGFLQPSQAWNEVRRTGYPVLYFPTDATAQVLKNVPNRVRYPSSERNNNATNYNNAVQKMGGTDDAYIKLFWAK
ncbi:MAG: SusD/RagB family nutrient-binding outer membrane lipoprotein [Bacteroidales bacterium]|nr:SusD/RagB family nutrient-binding outer membrane lipoprotein [Bacteroidales bacterium]